MDIEYIRKIHERASWVKEKTRGRPERRSECDPVGSMWVNYITKRARWRKKS